MRAILPNIAESALVGFIVGFVLGLVTGHFVLALVPALIGALVFAAGRFGLAVLTEESLTRRR